MVKRRPSLLPSPFLKVLAGALIMLVCLGSSAAGRIWAAEPGSAGAPAAPGQDEQPERVLVQDSEVPAAEAGRTGARPIAPGPPPAEAGGVEVREEERERGIVDVVHAVISRGILGTAEWLDSFFDDPRYEVEENRTRVKVDVDAVLEKGSRAEVTVPLSLKVALPHLQETARFVVQGAPDKDLESEGTSGTEGTAASRLPGAQDRNVTTALDVFLLATDRDNVAFRIGVRFREGEPEMFVQPRYRLLIPLDPWALRFTQSLRWWTEFGWEEATTVDLERPVAEKLFFRTTLQGAWTQQEKGYLYSLSFVLRHPLSPRRALQYEWVNSFQTRPQNQANEYLAVVRYRQKIWRDWLFFEIAPQASFRRDRDFDLAPGILFRIELIFGRY